MRVILAAGARSVIVAATHGVLSDPAAQRLSECGASEVVITDTLPIAADKQFPQKRPDGTSLHPVMPAAFGHMTDMELKAL